MKIIIIKNCKIGKVNEIKEVADGYAKNFLIKQGYAKPANESNKKQLNTRLEKISVNNQNEIDECLKTKILIEAMVLNFSLKTTGLIVHGSITTKQIIKALSEKSIKINKYALGHVQISSIGLTNLKVKLHKKVEATLKIQVGKDGK